MEAQMEGLLEAVAMWISKLVRADKQTLQEKNTSIPAMNLLLKKDGKLSASSSRGAWAGIVGFTS